MAFGIVAAGGVGRRLEKDVPKLEIEVLGKPLLMYSLESFQEAACVDAVVLVVPGLSLSNWTVGRLQGAGIDKIVAVVAGGETRQESVFAALGAAPVQSGTVVVHDGARPLVTPRLIDEVCRAAADIGGAIAAVPVIDTIKQVESGLVETTIARERLVAVQTPQAFSLEILKRAHQKARQDGFTGTDDASLVERIGGSVAIVEGSRENIKVTHREDLITVEAILRTGRHN